MPPQTGWQTPATQLPSAPSSVVHSPFSLAGSVPQMPSAPLQTPVLHSSFFAEQSTALPAQTPPVQMSCSVQRSSSSQPWPSSGAESAKQLPSAGLQVPTLHWSPDPEQSTALPAQ